MKLLDSIRRHPVDNCIILTYNADLLFFEYMLFEPLYGAGCRNTLVICDPAQYQYALADTSLLRFAGQRYWIRPGLTSPTGAFHPKLILLTSADKGRLFLTSGNLTKPGYAHNWEVASIFEFNVKQPNLTAWQACQWAIDSVRQIVEQSRDSTIANEWIEQLIGTTPWLRNEPALGETEHVWLLHNLDLPLLDQIYDKYRLLDGSPVLEALVVSPFFDAAARAFAEVQRRFRPESWRIYTQGVEHGLNRRALVSALGAVVPSIRLNELSVDGRRLHAKALLLRSSQGTWLMTGSANFSAPALLHPVATGNTEMVSLRYEPDRSYFDPWLAELIGRGIPLALDTLPETATPGEPMTQAERRIELIGATLQKNTLRLQLAERLAPEAAVVLHLHQETAKAFHLGSWQQDADGTLAYPVDSMLLAEFQRPTLVSIDVSVGGITLASTISLLHNLDALQRFGRPIDRRERPRIPDGLHPDDDEHAIQLVEMLHELLATNGELLRRHQGRIATAAEQQDQEQRMVVEEGEDYDPQAHFVDEVVRTGATGTGASLYADYFDRLTYEDLLRAALSAVRPLVQPATAEDESPSSADEPEHPSRPRPSPPDAAVRARAIERIQYGFQRLVGSFVQGVSDTEYLARVPPVYLAELYVIITAYLREVWRQGILPNERFVEHSVALLQSFWGDVGVPGAWQAVQARLSQADVQREEQRLSLIAQSWFHAFIVAKLAEQASARTLCGLAAWMRSAASRFSPPQVLQQLPESVYRRLRRFSLPMDWPKYEPHEVVDYLGNIMPRYDKATLLQEIATWPGTRVKDELKRIADLAQVPTLEVKTPLATDELDRCVRAFTRFVIWPYPKPAAWARFTNTNPAIFDDDMRSIRMFFRKDERSLLFAVESASGAFSEIEKWSEEASSLSGVITVEHLKALPDHPNA